MIPRSSFRRLAVAAAATALFLVAPGARAQDPVRADTAEVAPPDTFRVGIPPGAVTPDTVVEAVAPDSVLPDSARPAPNFPVFPLFPTPRPSAFAQGRWVWEKVDLDRFHGLSLVDLLERVPGLVITREGDFGRPLGVASFGGGGGRLRVFLDGWELRALGSSTFDLQRIALVDIEQIVVTRRMSEVRVDLFTVRLDDARPFAQIEAADGDFDTRILRAMFARPVGERFLGAVGLDLVETDGFRRRAEFGFNTGFARVGYAFAPQSAVMVEYRSWSVDGERTLLDNTRLPTESVDGGTVLLRGRGRLTGRLWLDGALGRQWQTPAGEDQLSQRAESVQAMARATLELPWGLIGGAAHLHRVEEEGFAADATELSARAELSPSPVLDAWGELRALSVGGVTGLEAEASVRLGGWGGLSVFGSAAAGSRGIRFLRDTVLQLRPIAGVGDPGLPTAEVPTVLFRTRESSLGGLRAGAEWVRGGFLAGAAFVTHRVDEVAPFGFAFDRGIEPVGGGTVSGAEGYVSVPLIWPALRLDAWTAAFLDSPERPYLPRYLGRAALEFHDRFFEGNLEPTFRWELVFRGEAIAPVLLATTGGVEQRTLPTDPYAFSNLYVQVRILDVRAFWRMENILNRSQAFDIPGRTLPGARQMFGVRWFFRD